MQRIRDEIDKYIISHEQLKESFGNREKLLLDEIKGFRAFCETLRTEISRLQMESGAKALAFKIIHDRCNAFEVDADRLAAIVRQTVTDIETTAVLLEDDSPPLLLEEREALRLHEEIAKRT